MNKFSFLKPFRGSKRASGREVGTPRRRRRSFELGSLLRLEIRQLLAASFNTTVSYSVTVPQQVTDYTTNVFLPTFNTSLGTLDQVDLTYAAQGTSNGTVTNNGPAAETFTIGVVSSQGLYDGVTQLLDPSLTASQTFTDLAPGDSGLFGPFSPTQSASATFTNGAVFNDFEGGAGVINLTLTTNSVQNTTGAGGNSATDLNTTTGGTATVTYTYTVTPVSISGNVYDDVKGAGSLQPGDLPIPGTTLTLVGLNGTAVATTTTAADGTYSFTTTSTGSPLLAGFYDVVETQPAGYLQGTNTVGKVDGVTNGVQPLPDVIGGIDLLPGQDSINNNFGEVKPVGLSGIVYEDVKGIGVLAPGDNFIPDVTLTLLNSAGAVVGTTTTNSLGAYDFQTTASGAPLPPGTYTVVESQPAGYLQGSNTVGAVNGVPDGALTGVDTIGSIVLNSGQLSFGNNFGEVLPVGLSGTVYDDVDHSGSLSPGDTPIGDVTVNLFDASGVVATTTTDAFGNYAFTTTASGVPAPAGQLHPRRGSAGRLPPGDQLGRDGQRLPHRHPAGAGRDWLHRPELGPGQHPQQLRRADADSAPSPAATTTAH